ncbi:MAG: hypothetical protein QXW32_03150 [Nitrososphaerales archaeon]
MWVRCGVDVWHLECRAGGEINLAEGKVEAKCHDFIASVTRRGDRLELFIPPSYTKIFDSNKSLNEYLKKVGLEEVNIPLKL